MSRLFSRLENIGQDQAGAAPPAGTAPVPDGPPAVDFPAAANGGNPTAAPAAANTPITPPLAPGYAISTSLSMPSPPRPGVRERKPVWPVRLWLGSLLLLIALSLLMLAVPERLLPLSVQQAPPAAPAVSAGAAAAPPSPAPAKSQAPAAGSTIVTARPAPAPASTGAPRAAPAAAAAPAPSPSGGSAACSEAMLAMSLCSKSSP